MLSRETKDGLRGYILADVQSILDSVKEYPINGKEFKSLFLRISKQTTIPPLRELIAGGSVYIHDKKEYTRTAVFSHVANVVFNSIENILTKKR